MTLMEAHPVTSLLRGIDNCQQCVISFVKATPEEVQVRMACLDEGDTR